MFFGFCYSTFSKGEVIAQVSGYTIDEILAEFEEQEIDFDDAFSEGRITIIEGDIVTLRQTMTYDIIRDR